MSLLRLDASIRSDGSASRQLADIVEASWDREAAKAPVVRRHIGVNPLPSDSWALANAGSLVRAGDRTVEQQGAIDVATTLVDELAAADAYLFAVPLYNFVVSQHFKTYIDIVTTDPRMAPGGEPITSGKHAVLVTVQGGNYSPGSPRAGWDHATDWMCRILGDVWNVTLEVVKREFTLVGVNPALDAFADEGHRIKVAAEERARESGRFLERRPVR